MPQIRALTDLNLSGFAIPHNRVAEVDDNVAAVYIAAGQATEAEAAVAQALLMNPDIIDLAGIDPFGAPAPEPEPAPTGKKAKAAAVEPPPADPAAETLAEPATE